MKRVFLNTNISFMKQATFYKPPTLILSLLLLMFASCTKQRADIVPVDGSTEDVTAKGGPKPGTYPEVALKLSVSDAAENKITSDGAGDYFNGQQNLKVVFDVYGNFIFSGASNNPNVPLTRYIKYDFSNPSPLTPNATVTGIYTGNFISTGQTATNPDNTPLQNLAINATKCIGLSAGLLNLEGGVVNFHRNQSTEDTPGTPTAFVYVTRINPAQWLVSPIPPSTGGCSDISNIAALRVNTALYGYYNMPFLFTLTKL
jgi:hypothetical protein